MDRSFALAQYKFWIADCHLKSSKAFGTGVIVEADDRTEIEANGEIVVFSILKPSACAECGEELWKGSFLRMEKGKPLCLECADLDHLVFIPRGDAALTRRSRKYSTLSAVVVRFSRSRKRYERQGLLVESAALERAEEECLSDEAKRRIARDKAALVREQADHQYVAQFTESICSRYPDCPPDEAEAIAKHACEKYSGRVGRSAAAKSFGATAIDLAVKAHVRHTHTEYDRLLSRGWERSEARSAVLERVREIMERWRRA
jgi:hypothetical protein